MDQLIEIPIWAVFWVFFVGVIAGAFLGFWLDSILERWIEKGDSLKNLNKKLREIRNAEKN